VVGAFGQHLGEQLGALDQMVGRLGEEVVEGGVNGSESQTHGKLLVRRERPPTA